MTAAGYEATLVTLNSDPQHREFAQLSDAINWLAGEFEAGDGYFVSGEIRHEGKLVWRRGAPTKQA